MAYPEAAKEGECETPRAKRAMQHSMFQKRGSTPGGSRKQSRGESE